MNRDIITVALPAVASNGAALVAIVTDNQVLALGTFVVTVGGVGVTLMKQWWEGRNAQVGRDLAIAQARLHDQDLYMRGQLNLMAEMQAKLRVENGRLLDLLLDGHRRALLIEREAVAGPSPAPAPSPQAETT